jgi:hypothetical protein
MTGAFDMDPEEQSVGVYPPSFCDWRLLLAVMVITEVSVVLTGLGNRGLPLWQWLAAASLAGPAACLQEARGGEAG